MNCSVVHIPKSCIKDIKKHGGEQLVSRVYSILKQVHDQGSLTPTFDPYAGVLYKRQLERRKYRLIAAVIHNEIYILDFLLRKGKECSDLYETKNKDKLLAWRDKKHTRNSDDYFSWKPEQISVEDSDTPCLEEPPAGLTNWLQASNSNADLGNDATIYESAYWVEEIINMERQHWPAFCALIEKLANRILSDSGETEIKFDEIKDETGKTIFYSFVPDENGTVCGVLLFGLSKGNTGRKYEDAGQHSRATAQKWLSADTPDAVRVYARRAYRYCILCNCDDWYDIQESKENNLALSPEEEDLLEGIMTKTAAEGNGMPIFINGSAGSGKSTMLQWAFAKCCLDSLAPGSGGWHPYYLTWNKYLLENAKDKVSKLLLTNADNKLAHDASPEDAKWVASELMMPFTDLLKKLLRENNPDIYVKECFNDEEKHIDLPEFKKLIDKKNLQKVLMNYNLSPNLCWHVIRVFIKGYYSASRSNASEFLTSENYNKDLPKSDQTISPEAYKNVWEHVWPKYKEWCREDQLWDQQDLVKRVLQLGLQRPVFEERPSASDEDFPQGVAAVFCDEAQDLTRLQLEFVMRMSSFNDFDMRNLAYADRLPFVFAGDPLQTVQPTGFRWGSFKGAFTEMIIEPLIPNDRQWNINPNEETLKLNYRSAEPIVKVSNLIQLLRRHLFKETIKPQQTWHHVDDTQPPPVLFSVDSNNPPKELAEYLKGSIVIIPCEIGQEEEWIRDNKVLQSILPEDSESRKNMVLSSARAKGLEFKQVVLFGFGEEFNARKLEDLVHEGNSSHEMNEASRLELEYHLNKLYVAISRPTRQLYIIETKEAKASFWDKLYQQREYMASKNSNEDWGVLTDQEFATGTEAHFPEFNQTPDDWRAIADRYVENAKLEANHDLFERAAHYYKLIGDQESQIMAKTCKANSLQIKKKYKDAADLFRQLGKHKDELDCLWTGFLWGEYLERTKNPKSWKAKLSVLMNEADSLVDLEISDKAKDKTKLTVSMRSDLVSLVQRIGAFIDSHIQGEASPLPSVDSCQWFEIVRMYRTIVDMLCAGRLSLGYIQEEKEQLRKQTANVLDSLVDLGFVDCESVLAKACFWSGRDVDAVELVDGSELLSELVPESEYSNLYHVAKSANYAEFDQKLQSLMKVKSSAFEALVPIILDFWDKEDKRYEIDSAVLARLKPIKPLLVEACSNPERVCDFIRFELIDDSVNWDNIRSIIKEFSSAKKLDQVEHENIFVVIALVAERDNFVVKALRELQLSKIRSNSGANVAWVKQVRDVLNQIFMPHCLKLIARSETPISFEDFKVIRRVIKDSGASLSRAEIASIVELGQIHEDSIAMYADIFDDKGVSVENKKHAEVRWVKTHERGLDAFQNEIAKSRRKSDISEFKARKRISEPELKNAGRFPTASEINPLSASMIEPKFNYDHASEAQQAAKEELTAETMRKNFEKMSVEEKGKFIKGL